MAKRDYYEVLGVSRDVAPQELKKIYRQLAMKYHPDQNPDDDQATEKFKELTEAYQVLSDPNKRARYNRFGHDAPDIGFGGSAVDVSSMADFFDSVFGSVFGGGGTRQRRRRRGKPGRDLQYDLEITLENTIQGLDVKITVPRPVRCSDCEGIGAAAGTAPDRCSQCDGTGTMRLQQGIFAVSTTCRACGGIGEVIRSHCTACKGTGLVIEEEDFDVSIPPGVDDGAVKVIPNAGEHGRRGAPDGDLHVMIHVKKHEHFVRRGQDLHAAVQVNYPQAVLGAEIDVPTIEGPTKMRIKPGSEHGQVYRIRGKGIPSLRSRSRGDQHVHIEVAIPTQLTSHQEELIKELGRELGNEVESKPHSLIDKLKNLFD
ncbi:MAG: molecular chaperone DnaJ [Proteobacteria bacterium]|nr:molecular chaperone DnaJ [Pseudomonadota bacterium]